jgi:hypothetical protein
MRALLSRFLLAAAHHTDAQKRPAETQQQKQLQHLQDYGYVVIRGALDKRSTAQLRQKVDVELQKVQNSPQYLLHRILFSVNAPRNRHELLLDPADPTVAHAMSRIVQSHEDFFGGLFVSEGCEYDGFSVPLVELGAMVSFPGAQAQDAHTDVPWSEVTLCTAFVALQNTTNECLGPTMIHPATHTQQFHTRLEEQFREEQESDSKMTNNSVVETLLARYETMCRSIAPRALDLIRDRPREAIPAALTIPEHQAVPMLLEEGDMVVMDTRVFHWGGENRAPNSGIEAPGHAAAGVRRLLQFSFQAPEKGGAMQKELGYVNIIDGAEGEHSLGGFLRR